MTMSTWGEEGLQELGSGGRPALGFFFRFPSFPGDTSLGTVTPGGKESRGSPTPQCRGFLRECDHLD